jgi:chemotaxis protein CheX
MMGIPIFMLDEISKSAVTEVTNMILGNAASLLFRKGIKIDITPPTLFMGDDMRISALGLKTICVPLKIGSGEIIELDIVAN